MSLKNSNDTIGNRTCDLVAQCRNQLRHSVPQDIIIIIIIVVVIIIIIIYGWIYGF
jgi:uncharacterized membrane protein YvbJ